MIDKKLTNEHSKKKTNKEVVFWKIFIVDSWSNNLRTLFMGEKIENKTSLVKAKGDLDVCNSNGINYIEGGCCHAYTKESKAKDLIKENKYFYDGIFKKHIVVEIVVKEEDIVAFSENEEVCFFKYKILESSWEKINKEIKKLKS
jgi:hypothetical protein